MHASTSGTAVVQSVVHMCAFLPVCPCMFSPGADLLGMAHCACSPLLRHCFCCTERWPSSRQCLSCKRNRTAWCATLFVRAQIFCFSSTLHSIALAKVQSQVLHCCVPLSLCLILHLVELSHASHHQLGANNDCPLPLHCFFSSCALRVVAHLLGWSGFALLRQRSTFICAAACGRTHSRS